VLELRFRSGEGLVVPPVPANSTWFPAGPISALSASSNFGLTWF
jgi:hypothetical protein